MPDAVSSYPNVSNYDFSVMTINLRFGLADDGQNNWDFRKQRFKALFKQYKPDFISCQEANDFQIDYLQDILQEYSFIGKRQDAPSYWQDNIIFYRKTWHCIKKDRFFLSNTPDVPSSLPESKWPRQCVIGLFQKDKQSILCVNTHFDFTVEVRVKSAKIILKRLLFFPEKYPTVLMGDFNAKAYSPCYKIFTTPDSTGQKFQDIFEHQQICTHHGFTGKCLGGYIDWILYKGDIDLQHKEVISRQFENGYPSDHFPVIAYFNFLGGPHV